MSQRILVLGCGDVGSAVAHRLYLQGADVVLADIDAPAHPRRGMAFTDAWFDGTAMLDGVVAQRLADPSELPQALAMLDAVCCASAQPGEAAEALRPHAVVDARMRKRSQPEDLRPLAGLVIGLGPGFTPGANCTVAIETAWGDCLGEVLPNQAAAPLSGEPRSLGGASRERFVYAAAAGEWRTRRRIGEDVDIGAEVGTLQGKPVAAPLTSVLRGLTHDRITVRAAQKIVEVDPSVQPNTHGLGMRPSIIARGVARALGYPAGIDDAFFDFEAEFRVTLDCMPMSMRRKLDRCGLKLSLEQWRALPIPLRECFLEATFAAPRELERLARLLRRLAARLGWADLPSVQDPTAAISALDTVPEAVQVRCPGWPGTPHLGERWRRLTHLQRYALVKLVGSRSGKNWPAALGEFGLTSPRA